MSNIDLSNPSVLANFIKTQMREGKGEYIKKTDVLIFKDYNGNEYLCSADIVADYEANKIKVVPKPVEEVDLSSSPKRRRAK